MHLLGPISPRLRARPPVDREQVLAGGAAARDRKVAAEYDRLAEQYAAALGDELDGKSFDRWLLARLAAEAAGGQGLDVGCGPAHVAGFLADHGVVMTGLDLSPNMVAEARAREPDVHVVQGSFVVPPMPRGGDPRDPGWALVTAWYAFVHLAQSELVPTITALTRVLRRGGCWPSPPMSATRCSHPGRPLGSLHRPGLRSPRSRCGRRGGGGGRPGRHRVVSEEPAAAGGTDSAALSSWAAALG